AAGLGCGRWWRWRPGGRNSMNRLIIVVGILGLAGCAPAPPAPAQATPPELAQATPPEPSRPANKPSVEQQVFGGKKNFELLIGSAKVTASRLKPGEPKSPHHGNISWDEQLAAYVQGPWVEVSATQADPFRGGFGDPQTYRFDSAKGCIPHFGVRVRFESVNGLIEVSLCFECDILVVTRDGKVVGGEDFDGGSNELRALVKELFPDDAEIQSLKSR